MQLRTSNGIDPTLFNYFWLASEAIASAVHERRVTIGTSRIDLIKFYEENIIFAKENKRLIQMYCDCSDNFTATRLIKDIIRLNKGFIAKLKK
jgi:hypothetical protein